MLGKSASSWDACLSSEEGPTDLRQLAPESLTSHDGADSVSVGKCQTGFSWIEGVVVVVVVGTVNRK